MPDLLNLYRHIHQKHPGEVELYEGVIKAIKTKLADAIPADLSRLLNEEGDEAPVMAPDAVEMAAFEDAEAVLSTPAVAPETFEPVQARRDCPDCGWVNTKNTLPGLEIHQRRWCKKDGA